MDNCSQPAGGIKYIFLKFFPCCSSRTERPLIQETAEIRSEKLFNSLLFVCPINKLSELSSDDAMVPLPLPIELAPTVSILSNGMNKVVNPLWATKAYQKDRWLGKKILGVAVATVALRSLPQMASEKEAEVREIALTFNQLSYF